jgi:glycosyltransferase involved in cell wall biosynthesis
VVINNGIDQKKFNPQIQFKNIRKELGIPEESILILFIARLTSHKQPLALINAFAKAFPSAPEMHLLMVGDGDQRQEVANLVQELNLSNKITLNSFRQDVPDILAAADIFVLPSLWEGLPIGLLEAMAMGKAVIATNVDGTCEIIQNNENGILVETDTLIPALAAALVKLSKDKSLRDKFSDSAVKTVNEKYNAAVMTRQIEDIYTGLLKK